MFTRQIGGTMALLEMLIGAVLVFLLVLGIGYLMHLAGWLR